VVLSVGTAVASGQSASLSIQAAANIAFWRRRHRQIALVTRRSKSTAGRRELPDIARLNDACLLDMERGALKWPARFNSTTATTRRRPSEQWTGTQTFAQ
jgi:hypothetical protein